MKRGKATIILEPVLPHRFESNYFYLRYFEELSKSIPVALFTNDLRAIRKVIGSAENFKKTIIITDVNIRSTNSIHPVMSYEAYNDYLTNKGSVNQLNLIFGPSKNEMALKQYLVNTVDSLISQERCWFIDDTELQFATIIKKTILHIKSAKTKPDLYYSTMSKTGIYDAPYLKAFTELVTSQISTDTYRMLNFFASSKGWHEADIYKHIRRLHGNYIFELSQYYSILNESIFVPMFDAKTQLEVPLKEIEACSKRAQNVRAPTSVIEAEQLKLFTDKKFDNPDHNDVLIAIKENGKEYKNETHQLKDILKGIRETLDLLSASLSAEKFESMITHYERLSEGLEQHSLATTRALKALEDNGAETPSKNREPPKSDDKSSKQLVNLLETICKDNDEVLKNFLELKTLLTKITSSEKKELSLDEEFLKKLARTVIMEMNEVTDFYDSSYPDNIKSVLSDTESDSSMKERLKKRINKTK